MLPAEYSLRVQHPVGVGHRTDIEEALDAVARNSALLNLPEQEPDMWGFQRTRLTEAEVVQLNRYRRKFGLPEVRPTPSPHPQPNRGAAAQQQRSPG
jgi:hypothetical protein